MQSQNQTRNRRISLAVCRCLTVLALLAIMANCAPTSGKKPMNSFNEPTITYGAGRFVVDIPAAMSFAGQYYLQGRAINEVVWPNDEDALSGWQKHLDEISWLEPPQGMTGALIEERDIPGIGIWCKAAFYFNEPLDPVYGAMDLLLNKSTIGLWIKARDKKISAKETVYEISTDIARAYRAPRQRFGRSKVLNDRDAFYLRYGAVDLPFEYEESVDIVFKEHALDKTLVLSIETDVVGKVYWVGLMDRLAAMIAGNFVPGFKIEKIRTRTRMVAGLEGEEVIYRGIEKDGTRGLCFAWDYPGERIAPHAPNIVIDMLARDSHLEEKLALWDAVLDSLRPAGR